MVTLLFKLLTIQMTMQLTMATALEGRTAHYVDLLETTIADEDAERLTCAVYSIRPADEAIKYYKYAASETQFNKTNDWTPKTNAVTFKQCAKAAAAGNYKMFFFDDNECKVSSSLFTRKLPEPCADDTATVVYMIELPETSCEGEYLALDDGSYYPGLVCGRTYDAPKTKCNNGRVTLSGIVTQGVGEECFRLFPMGVEGHEEQNAICFDWDYASCAPSENSDRATYVQNLITLSRTVNLKFAVNLNYLSSPSLQWEWGNTGIVQPTDEPGEWDASSLLSDYVSNPYAYMTQTGLTNNNDDNSIAYICCV